MGKLPDTCARRKKWVSRMVSGRIRVSVDQQQGIECLRRRLPDWCCSKLVVGIDTGRHGNGGKPVGPRCGDIRRRVANDTHFDAGPGKLLRALAIRSERTACRSLKPPKVK